MSVKITDLCISCGACIDECPVEAIVDDSDNPTGESIYYVFANKCVECVGHHDEPACAAVCPTEGCIVWDSVAEGQQVSRSDISNDMRSSGASVAS